MNENIQCNKCNISVEELRTAGELGDAQLVSAIGYCLNCCPEEELFRLSGSIKQVLSDR
jgi:hypothetical protein